MGDLVESVRQSPAYGPVGILAGAGMWFGIRTILSRLQLIDVRDLMNSFLAIMFSGIYIYLWTQGENPHDGELKPNELPFEIPLLMAGAAYVAVVYPVVLPQLAGLYFVALAAILTSMYAQQGATLANVYAFLYHAPEVVQAVINVLKAKNSDETVTKVLGYVYILLFLGSVGGMLYTTYVIVMGESPPVSVEAFSVLYTLLAVGAKIPNIIATFAAGDEKKGRRGRSRSRCRAKSRSRSRSVRRRRC